MDLSLITSLKNKINSLDNSDCNCGLNSALHHIEAATKHLLRGQKENDDSAFADAIYRTNLAFDCCIKEAYRTLAGRNPALKSMPDIESYLTGHKIFRSRILKQFTDYQTGWRLDADNNEPLDFNQSDAFMAITTISSFAVLLIDQISEHQSYLKSQDTGKICQRSQAVTVPFHSDLLSRTVTVVQQFCTINSPLTHLVAQYSEEQFISAVQGFISTVAPELSVILQGNLPISSKYHAALIIIRGREKVLFEFKHNVVNENISALSSLTEQDMCTNGIRYGILFCFSRHSESFKVEERQIESIRGKLVTFSG